MHSFLTIVKVNLLLSQSDFWRLVRVVVPIPIAIGNRESKPGKFERVIGDLSEWSNEQAWKVCIRASVSRVRIPQSPH